MKRGFTRAATLGVWLWEKISDSSPRSVLYRRRNGWLGRFQVFCSGVIAHGNKLDSFSTAPHNSLSRAEAQVDSSGRDPACSHTNEEGRHLDGSSAGFVQLPSSLEKSWRIVVHATPRHGRLCLLIAPVGLPWCVAMHAETIAGPGFDASK